MCLTYSEYQAHPDNDQTAYSDAWKKYHKTACTVFLRMNTWMFETCPRHYNWIKTLMYIKCAFCWFLLHRYWKRQHFKRCLTHNNTMYISVLMNIIARYLTSVSLAYCDASVAQLLPSFSRVGLGVYEGVPKIFRTGAAIYTAVVVAWSTGRC
jgi:hypothetical protein